MAAQQRRKRRKKRYRINQRYLAFRLIVLAFVTILLVRSGVKKIAETAMDDQYPIAQSKFSALQEETGNIRAISTMFHADRLEKAESNTGSRLTLKKDEPAPPKSVSVNLYTPVTESEQAAKEEPETELIDVERDVFRGKLLKIKDPSRVFVGVPGPLGPEYAGKQLSDMVASYGAMAGVNASGFEDPGGLGNGGTPLGIVISEGELCYGSLWGNYEIVGFDNENKLHCGYVTGQQAMDMGIRDAACFGPTLIVDGVKQNTTGYSGYNPRTVIGQTEDGTVLILLIEGREISSIGATFSDAADLLLEYGAVTAGNMDGGASSVMIYEGQQITISSSLYGAREMPSCWLVKPET